MKVVQIKIKDLQYGIHPKTIHIVHKRYLCICINLLCTPHKILLEWYPTFCSWDMNMYLVNSAFPTRPIALIAATTVSVFGFKFQSFSCSVIADYLHRAEYANDSFTMVTNGPYQAHSWGGASDAAAPGSKVGSKMYILNEIIWFYAFNHY